jgi:hypothetical protein
MPKITPNKIGRQFKKAKRVNQDDGGPVEGDENRRSNRTLFTPPPAKKQRTGVTVVLQEQTINDNWIGGGSTSSTNGTLEEVLHGWDQLTPAKVASKLAKLLKIAFDKQSDIELAIELTVEELDLDEDYMPSDDDSDEDEDVMAVTPMKTLLPKKAPKTVIPVSYKRDIFRYHRNVSPAIEVPKETMKTNLRRCKKKITKALDYCGSEQHQMYMIHKVLAKGAKAGIGLGLGLLTSPIRDEAAAKKTILCIDDFLHSEEVRVMGSNTNDSLAFQKTVFLLMAATRPACSQCHRGREDGPQDDCA